MVAIPDPESRDDDAGREMLCLASVLRDALDRPAADGRPKAEHLAELMVDRALAGDRPMLELLLSRLPVEDESLARRAAEELARRGRRRPR